jgi:hypothetical protein
MASAQRETELGRCAVVPQASAVFRKPRPRGCTVSGRAAIRPSWAGRKLEGPVAGHSRCRFWSRRMAVPSVSVGWVQPLRWAR